ncbi:MAG: hypothetical protein U0984_16720, partial [Prosthecobacter sp.]|nr:hypothetical protein [Prosthecobacter sp.]
MKAKVIITDFISEPLDHERRILGDVADVTALRHVRIEVNHVHAQSLCAQGRGRTDAAHANHAKRTPAQPPQRRRLRIVPGFLCTAQTAVQKMRAPRQAHRHGDGGVRHVFGTVVGDVRHGDAAFTGREAIDIVKT